MSGRHVGRFLVRPKALSKAIDEVLGPVPVQRFVRHKERNVLDHLPERDPPHVRQRLRRAWARDDHERALDEFAPARR
jgi:putative transposase